MESAAVTPAAPAAPAAPATPARFGWRTVAVLAVLAWVVWWVWRRQGPRVPTVELQPNTAPPPPPLPGVPLTLTAKMAKVVDTQIPVVMTSGTSVPFDEDDIRQVVRVVLARLNALDESVSFIQQVSASKTQDSYKTVAYDLVVSVHDAKENVGLTLAISVLVAVSGTLYVRKLEHFNKSPTQEQGPAGIENGRGGLAAYEDPVSILSQMKVG